MIAIANVCENWAIGKGGNLIAHIPEDLENFRLTTIGGVCIMGRKTLDSLPGGKPLKNRINIILAEKDDLPEWRTRTLNERVCARDAPVLFYHSVEEALKAVERYPKDIVFVIGGDPIYRQFLPYCDTCYLTRTCLTPDDADAFFPNLGVYEDYGPHTIPVEKSELNRDRKSTRLNSSHAR